MFSQPGAPLALGVHEAMISSSPSTVPVAAMVLTVVALDLQLLVADWIVPAMIQHIADHHIHTLVSGHARSTWLQQYGGTWLLSLDRWVQALPGQGREAGRAWK